MLDAGHSHIVVMVLMSALSLLLRAGTTLSLSKTHIIIIGLHETNLEWFLGHARE